MREIGDMERVKGIEPSYEAWEAAVLPLNYTRSGVVPRHKTGAEAKIIAWVFPPQAVPPQFAVMPAAFTTLPQRSSSAWV